MRHHFEVVAFDADDTLWHSEESFRKNERQFVDLVRPYVADGVDIKSALVAIEGANLSTYGYGVKSFGLCAVEAASHSRTEPFLRKFLSKSLHR
ncbi:MAG: hypothetical protein EBQ75_01810 [Actinobacteria bacterium]|nr:hypothetical protein [Actinomycetota bacterium]